MTSLLKILAIVSLNNLIWNKFTASPSLSTTSSSHSKDFKNKEIKFQQPKSPLRQFAEPLETDSSNPAEQKDKSTQTVPQALPSEEDTLDLVSSSLTFLLVEYIFYKKVKHDELEQMDFSTLLSETTILKSALKQALKAGNISLPDSDEEEIISQFESGKITDLLTTFTEKTHNYSSLNSLATDQLILESSDVYITYSSSLLPSIISFFDIHTFYSNLQSTILESTLKDSSSDSSTLKKWAQTFSSLLTILDESQNSSQSENDIHSYLHKLLKELEHFLKSQTSSDRINESKLKKLLHTLFRFSKKRNKFVKRIIHKLKVKLQDEGKFLKTLKKGKEGISIGDYFSKELILHETFRSLSPILTQLFGVLEEYIGNAKIEKMGLLQKIRLIQNVGQLSAGFYHQHKKSIDSILIGKVTDRVKNGKTLIKDKIKRAAIKVLRKIMKYFPEKLMEIVLSIFVSGNLAESLVKLVERMRGVLDEM